MEEDSRYKDIPFELVRDTFLKNFGNVSATCRTLQIDRSTFRNWVNKYPQLKGMIEEADEYCLDLAEAKLLTAINEENLTAIIFYLKTKGKKRGYIETIENNVKVEQPVQLSMKEAQNFIKNIEEEF